MRSLLRASSIVLLLMAVSCTKKPVSYVDIRLGGPSMSYSGMEGLTFYADESYGIEPVGEPEGEDTIEPGAERVYEFKVTPQEGSATQLGLLVKADATVVIDEDKNKYLYFGAMEAVTIARPQPAPAPTPAAPEAPASPTVAGK